MIDCAHKFTRMVWTNINGYGKPMRVRQLRNQCLSCGLLTEEMLRHSLATPNTPEVDVELLNRGIRAREEYYRQRSEEIIQKQKAEREAEAEDWWRRYDHYLQTDEWHERRQLVMQRANRICEGCRQAPATEVHHLTYKHVGNEFLWELVAICRECHGRYHFGADQ